MNPFTLISELDNYSIVKLEPGINHILKGKDIDIFCADMHQSARELLTLLQPHISAKTAVRVETTPQFVHVDFLENGALLVRFDLFEKPHFRKNRVADGFTKALLAGSLDRTHGGHVVHVAHPAFDAVIRQLSLHDNPGKTHHGTALRKLSATDEKRYKQLLKKFVTRRWWWSLDQFRHKVGL